MAVLELDDQVPIMQGFHYFIQQIPQLLVRYSVFLIQFRKLGVILPVHIVPVQSVLQFVVPQGIVGVHAVPEYLKLAHKAGIGLLKGHCVIECV